MKWPPFACHPRHDAAAVSAKPVGGGLTVISAASSVAWYMPSFLASWERQGVHPLVLGMGCAWRGNGVKVHLIRDFVCRCRPDTVVLFADAYDTVVVESVEKILQKYRSYGHPLVFSAERNCWPATYLEMVYPPSPTPYRFLNSGGWIGEAGYVAALLKRWNADGLPADQRSDQRWWSHRFVEDPAAIALDVHCRLFQCVEVEEDHLCEHGGVYNHVTGTHPSIIHGIGLKDLSLYLQWSGLPHAEPIPYQEQFARY